MKLNLDYDELPWLKQLEPTKVKTYKLTSANRTIKFHSMELDDMDGYDMCNHILNVKHAISQQVNAQQLGRALFDNYSRTLSRTMAPMWNQLITDLQAEAEGELEQSVANFDIAIERWVAISLTEEDTDDVRKWLLNPGEKPKDGVTVQQWYYLFQQVKILFPFLPGTREVPGDDDIKRSWFDSMPQAWRDRFNNAGNQFDDKTFPTLVNPKSLPKGANGKKGEPISLSTAGGAVKYDRYVELKGMRLPGSSHGLQQGNRHSQHCQTTNGRS